MALLIKFVTSIHFGLFVFVGIIVLLTVHHQFPIIGNYARKMAYQRLTKILVQQGNVSLERLRDPNTDAYRALEWMIEHDPMQLPLLYFSFSSSSSSSSSKTAVTPRIMVERFGLAVLYFATNGQDWTGHENWMTEASVCDWYGVECELESAAVSDWFDYAAMTESSEINWNVGDGKYLLQEQQQKRREREQQQQKENKEPKMEVVRIVLPNNRLQGTLPPEVSCISQLIVLDLGHNHLTGTLPQDDSLGHFRRLTDLTLSHNKIAGNIPASLGDNVILKHLSLDHNQFEGQIPLAMAYNLRNLRHWSLARNKLTGTIPTTIGGLRHIQVLEWNDNMLTGEIPSVFSQLSTLRKLQEER